MAPTSSGRDCCRIVATQFGIRSGGLLVDLVDFFIAELAVPDIDVLQRHDEYHGLTRLIIGPVKERFPGFGPQGHGAGEAINPRLPEGLVAVRVDLVDRFNPERLRDPGSDIIVVGHHRPDRLLRRGEVRELSIPRDAPDM